MKRTFGMFGIAALMLSLIGCGGGSGSLGSNSNALPLGSAQNGQTADSGASKSLTFGRLAAQVTSASSPVSSQGSGAIVTGLAGGVTSLVLNDTALNRNATRIAFERNHNLSIMNADGTGVKQVTNLQSSRDLTAAWSPDGSKLAFANTDNKGYHLAVMNADGTGQVNLTTNNNPDNYPSWSPDGKQIVFSRTGRQVFIVNADGTGLKQLPTTGKSTSPSWSPDGSQIAFSGQDSTTGYYHIYTIAPDGTGLQQITDEQASDDVPAWSPDGKQIAHLRYGTDVRLCLTPAKPGSFATPLTPANTGSGRPAWSPDGAKIVFEYVPNTTTIGHLYTINPDGTGLTQLTDGAFEDSNPAWSPSIKQRTLLGPGGALGSSSSGFFFGRSGDIVRSIAVFDTGSGQRDSVQIVPQTGNDSANSVNLSFSLSATSLTSFKFAQYPDWQPVTVTGFGNATTATSTAGALVDFSAQDGHLTAVLPYVSSRAAGRDAASVQSENGQRVYRGRFLGVWDSAGHNRAPDGATEVRMDSKSGNILSVR